MMLFEPRCALLPGGWLGKRANSLPNDEPHILKGMLVQISEGVDSGLIDIVFMCNHIGGVAGDERCYLFFREIKAYRGLFAFHAVKHYTMISEGGQGDRDRGVPADILLKRCGKLDVTGIGLIDENENRRTVFLSRCHGYMLL